MYEFRKPCHNIFISVPYQINKIVPVIEEGKLRGLWYPVFGIGLVSREINIVITNLIPPIEKSSPQI